LQYLKTSLLVHKQSNLQKQGEEVRNVGESLSGAPGILPEDLTPKINNR
jgi:hypothetical protein